MFRLFLPSRTPFSPRSLAYSAATGAPYPAATAAELAAKGYRSNLWLTRTHAALAGVALLTEEIPNGHPLPLSRGLVTLYNADQTTDPGRINALKGQLFPTHALTGLRLGPQASAAIAASARVISGDARTCNEWVTARECEILGWGRRGGSKERAGKGVSVEVVVEQTSTDPDGLPNVTEVRKVVEYVNLTELESPWRVRTAREMYPMAVSTGHKYSIEPALVLLKAAVRYGYSSCYWLTSEGCKDLGIQVRTPEQGVHLLLPRRNSEVVLYNADNTLGRANIVKAAYRSRLKPRSAKTGLLFPPETRSQLEKHREERGFGSPYWLTYPQAFVIGVKILSNERPKTIMMSGKVTNLFNADQTDNPRKVCLYAEDGRW